MLHSFLVKTYLLVLVLLPLSFYSCKRNNDDKAPNNNEVKAVIKLSSGNTVTINATGDKATFGRDFYGYTYVNGINEANASVNLMFQTIASPGTYSYLCEYRVDRNSVSSPIYVNASAFGVNPGSLTVTVASINHLEGSFTATCKTYANASDSAVVSGSFKGDF